MHEITQRLLDDNAKLHELIISYRKENQHMLSRLAELEKQLTRQQELIKKFNDHMLNSSLKNPV